MHLESTLTEKLRMIAKRPFGPGLTTEQAATTSKVEVWASSFTDPGPDSCEFRMFDLDGKHTGTVIVPGY